MARFALLLPREEMVEPAGRIARELEMDVVLNQSVPTERMKSYTMSSKSKRCPSSRAAW